MPTLTATITTWLWVVIAAGLFLLPGWMVVRRIPAPLPWVGAFLAAAAILFNLVLLLDAVHAPVHVGTVGIGLAAMAMALRWRAAKPAAGAPAESLEARLRGREWLWLLPVGLGLASIVARTLIDPLSGYDNSFRWDYLARLFLAQQSMANYPPITAAHFEFYGWCDGIPPLIPLLNFWIYSVSNSIAPELIALRVLGETLLLGVLVFHYSRLLWGPAGAAPALAALASSALALWSLATSQETGLTAITLVAMLYFLARHERAPSQPLLLWAAIAAGVGGLSRDYTLAYVPLGAAVLMIQRQPARRVMLFLAVAAAICAPWYLRNWIRTGNPLYPHTLGGLFPGNSVHDETVGYIARNYGFGSDTQSLGFLVMVTAVLAGLLILLGLVGIGRSRRDRLPLLAGLGLNVALWLWSMQYTAGGWIYSMRVLLPTLALLAVLAGWIGLLQRTARATIMIALCLAAGDAARRSWIAGFFPFSSPWSLSFGEWQIARVALAQIEAAPAWQSLVGSAAGRGIVVDHPIHHALVTMKRGRAVPFFSPILASTLGSESFVEVAASLRRDGIRYITFSSDNFLTEQFTHSHPFWRTLREKYRPNAKAKKLLIFDLDHLIEEPTP